MNRFLIMAIASALGVGCSGPATTIKTPVVKDKPIPIATTTAIPGPKEQPPESFPARPFTPVPATWAELPNGLKIVSRRDRVVPIVHLRIGVLAGSSVDGEFTGMSAICARAVGSSGAGSLRDAEVQGKLEALGATLNVDVDADRVVYGLSVVKDRLPEAFDILAQMVTKPQLNKDDVLRVQKHLIEEASDNARSDGRWGALMMLHQDLFEMPSEHHPYASYAATADELGKIKPEECKKWHRRHFVPSNMLVAASGDVEPAALQALAKKSFGLLSKTAAPTNSFTDPMPPGGMKFTLVDRPGSTQSEIVIGTLGPKLDDPAYPSFAVADQILGGTYTGRLFTDVREKRGLAYITFTSTEAYANGPAVFYLYAQTQNSSTGEAISALLDHLHTMLGDAPSQPETETASRFLAGWNAIDSGVPGRTANSFCDTWSNKQSDDAPEELAKAIRQTTPESVRKAFAEFVRDGHLIVVVAGDAKDIGPSLQRFGEIKVVDPTRNFARIKTLSFVDK